MNEDRSLVIAFVALLVFVTILIFGGHILRLLSPSEIRFEHDLAEFEAYCINRRDSVFFGRADFQNCPICNVNFDEPPFNGGGHNHYTRSPLKPTLDRFLQWRKTSKVDEWLRANGYEDWWRESQ